jgi:mRNA interferase RelE/StbE
MSFSVIFSTKSSKKIRSLDSDLKERIKNAIEELSNDPWENGTVKVKGHVDVRRKRVGNYRIIYHINEIRRELLVAIVTKKDEEIYKF